MAMREREMTKHDNEHRDEKTSVEADVARRMKPGPDFDPVNLMTQIFDDAASFVGPAEDVLLSWLMRLSPGVDQPNAARQVLETIVGDLIPDASGESIKLAELLRQSADQNKSALPDNGQRRGGRSARLQR
jgi:hypothetical protein